MINRDKIARDVLGKYYDEDLPGYDVGPVVRIPEVEEMISKAITKSEREFIKQLDNLFSEFSNNGYSPESLNTIKDFYNKLKDKIE